ncbi:MAG: carboxypeptidase regulatory-like domain-containing protein, partial [Candidatus Hydrogenedentes bacterium]|nr:carboxypeptidase regulatory-like domain-containing protein [Candidatus Hydrogenedentota bacterium]
MSKAGLAGLFVILLVVMVGIGLALLPGDDSGVIEPGADPAPVEEAAANSVERVSVPFQPVETPREDETGAELLPGAVVGSVYFNDGNLASGAAVTARWTRDSRGRDTTTEEEVLAVLPSGGAETVTDEAGVFHIEGLPLGTYLIVGRTDTAGAVDRVRLAARIPEARVDLILEPGRPLGGVVVNQQNAPVEGATVTPVTNDGDDVGSSTQEALTVTTDAEGRFLFPVLSPETWSFYAVADGYAPKVTEPLPVGLDTARIVLDAGEPLLGRVIARADGAPLPKVVVTAQQDPLYIEPVRTRSGGDGIFTFPGLAPGRYVINLDDPVLALEGGPQFVDIPRNTAALLELKAGRGGEIHGRLFDAATGEGIPDVSLYAMPVDHEGERRTSSATDSEGRFVIVGLSPGTYRLQPQGDAPGLPMQSRGLYDRQVPVAIDEIVEGVEIPVHRGLTIRGQVVTADGAPAANAFVIGRSDDGWYEQITSDTVGQ